MDQRGAVTDAHVALNDRAQVWRGQRHLDAMLSCSPGLAEEQSYYPRWVITALFLPILLELGLTGLCLGSHALHYIDPRRKMRRKLPVRGKHAPGPGDGQRDPGGKARASLG